VTGELTEATGRELRDEGLERVSSHNADWLERVRLEARRVSAWKGHVSADDVRERADKLGLVPTHRNAWGAVFKDEGWKPVGWKLSKRPAAHGRAVRVWTWIGVPAAPSEIPQGDQRDLFG